MMKRSICRPIGQRATRYAISWRVRVRRVGGSKWNVARGVNLSVSGILLQMPQPQQIGERLECEIDCFLRRGRKTVLHGVGDIVRHGNTRRTLAAIQFDVNGASIRSEAVTSADHLLADAKLVIVARSARHHDIGGESVTARERMPLAPAALDHAAGKIGGSTMWRLPSVPG